MNACVRRVACMHAGRQASPWRAWWVGAEDPGDELEGHMQHAGEGVPQRSTKMCKGLNDRMWAFGSILLVRCGDARTWTQGTPALFVKCALCLKQNLLQPSSLTWNGSAPSEAGVVMSSRRDCRASVPLEPPSPCRSNEVPRMSSVGRCEGEESSGPDMRKPDPEIGMRGEEEEEAA